MQQTTTAATTAPLFSSAFLTSLAGKHSALPSQRIQTLRSYAADRPGGSLGDACDAAYEDLCKNYRNEYVFKNTIVSKLVMGRHSTRTASALLEVPTGASIADVLVLNGTTTVYEVKTDLDTFNRLLGQIEDYRATFDHVNVVVSDARAVAAERVVPAGVGIIAVRKRGALSVVRPSVSSIDRMLPSRVFQVLRRQEVLSILKRTIGYDVDVPTGDIWTRTRELFSQLPLLVAHEEALNELKKRGMQAAPLVSSAGFPVSLRALAYGTDLSLAGQRRLADRLLCSADEFLS
jgi:hypothetical protein